MSNTINKRVKILKIELESLKEVDPYNNRIGVVILTSQVLQDTENLVNELLSEKIIDPEYV